jgi:hypothetical protein
MVSKKSIISTIADYLFYIKKNKSLYKDDWRYIAFRKFGSVVISMLALAILLSKFDLKIYEMVGYMFLSTLVYIVIVYHAVTNSILNKSYISYFIITLVLLGGWVANGYFFIEARLIKDKIALKVYDDEKYLKQKEKIENLKIKFLDLSEYEDKLKRLKGLNVNDEVEKMFNLRKKDKYSYYKTYIKPLKGKFDLPSIPKKASDKEIKAILKDIVIKNRDWQIFNIKSIIDTKLNQKLAEFKNIYKEDLEYLETLSKQYIANENKKIELENKKLEDKYLKEKIIYSIIFLIVGIFFELIVFSNNWINVKDKRIEEIDIRLAQISNVIKNLESYDKFLEAYNFNDSAKSATLFAMLNYLVSMKRDIDIESKRHFKVNDMIKIKNKKSNKNYFIERYIARFRKVFKLLDVNYYSLDNHLVKKIMEY